MQLLLCGCVMHVYHRMDQKLFFVTRVTFIKSQHKEEQLFNSPHKPLMKPVRFGRPMASKLRLPVTGMEILIYSLCLLTEVPPGDWPTILHQKYRRLLLRMESMSFSLLLYRIRQAVPCFLQEQWRNYIKFLLPADVPSKCWALLPNWSVLIKQGRIFFIRIVKVLRMNGESIILLPLREIFGYITPKRENIRTWQTGEERTVILCMHLMVMLSIF